MAQALKKKDKEMKGALAPLFDRLTDLDPRGDKEVTPYYKLDFENLKESIMAEVSLILNTRPTAKRQAEEEPEDRISDYALPIFFGLGDFSWFEAGSDFYLHQIARRVEGAIRYYEPRLKNPRARVSKVDQSILGVRVDIAGDIVIDDVKERLNFPIAVENLFSR